MGNQDLYDMLDNVERENIKRYEKIGVSCYFIIFGVWLLYNYYCPT